MNRDIRSVLLLGSGALKIAEAGEFDYSGSQAIKAFKEEKVRVVLVNPNIATVQTSADMADAVYFLPVNAYFVERVIEKEKPDGIVLSFGGQTALNCGMELSRKGILKKYSVRVLGTPVQALETTEDRALFARHLGMLGMKTARGVSVRSPGQATRAAKKLGFPVMLRTGFALGGSGSGIAKNQGELDALLAHALATSTHVIIEECLWGWKEIEYEVVRDREDNCMTVCNMENMDPVGIHTGESIVVAPSQTLNNEEYYGLRQVSLDVIRSLGIIGECNIQFALHPTSRDYRIIEVNARLSRSSALASKATGYPIAYVAAKLVLGKTLPQLRNAMNGKTSAFFEPSLDYIVVKIPRWDLDKFAGVHAHIGSEMKSVGEVMAIGRSFEEAVQKAARMLGDGYHGVIDARFDKESKTALGNRLTLADTMRLFTICSALRAGIAVSDIHTATGIDPWFLTRLNHIVSVYRALQGSSSLTPSLLYRAKRQGFSDRQIGDLVGVDEATIRKKRKRLGILPVVKRIDMMAGEFPVQTNYLYLTYHGDVPDHAVKKEQRVVVLGCGPYSIGTSVEFDWCAVYTAKTLREHGVKAIMVNCNPETVSTDYDQSDYLYFEELTLERVLDIYDIERAPMIVSVGGQIPNNLASKLSLYGVPILGTKTGDIYRAEHRNTFSILLDTLGVAQPPWANVQTLHRARGEAKRLGYPLLVRPSFVLSGKAMQVIEDEASLTSYLTSLPFSLSDHPLVMTKFLSDAVECDVDGVARNGQVLLFALSEHVESGGVHSGDSSLMLPAQGLSPLTAKGIEEATKQIVQALAIHGPFNIQYLIVSDEIFVIECNVRASRSFPFVSKATNTNFIALATRVMLGDNVPVPRSQSMLYTAVKVPQFSFRKLRGADPLLRVEMASTGEVCAFAPDAWGAYLTAWLATGMKYPEKKAAFVSLGGYKGKLRFLKGALLLHMMGYTLYATDGTVIFLRENAIPAIRVKKIYEAGQGMTVVDLMVQKRIDFAVVTTEASGGPVPPNAQKILTDGYIMRRMAIDLGLPIFTNSASARFFIEGIRRYTPKTLPIVSWQEYVGLSEDKKEVL